MTDQPDKERRPEEAADNRPPASYYTSPYLIFRIGGIDLFWVTRYRYDNLPPLAQGFMDEYMVLNKRE